MSLTTACQPETNMFKLNILDLTIRDNNGIDSALVVDAGVNFDLWMTFGGQGIDWKNFCNNSREYKVEYFADAKGTQGNLNLGHTLPGVHLSPSKTLYGEQDTKISAVINTPGIYELSCVVTFPNWSGYAGFIDGLMIEVIAP